VADSFEAADDRERLFSEFEQFNSNEIRQTDYFWASKAVRLFTSFGARVDILAVFISWVIQDFSRVYLSSAHDEVQLKKIKELDGIRSTMDIFLSCVKD